MRRNPRQMPEPRAQRTLVKSPPELWAEVSDPGALTRHLGEFGEIRITRSDPETTVAWEGDRVRGTVELEASGWGTKVTLTAQDVEPEPAAPPVEEVAAPAAAPARGAAPLPAPSPPAAPRPPASRRPGLLARFRRLPRGEVPHRVASTSPGARRPDMTAPPAPAAPVPAAPAGAAPARAAPLQVASASGPDPQAVEAVLVRALDELGSAQKRPFSR